MLQLDPHNMEDVQNHIGYYNQDRSHDFDQDHEDQNEHSFQAMLTGGRESEYQLCLWWEGLIRGFGYIDR